MFTRKARKLGKNMLIILLITGLIITGIPTELYAESPPVAPVAPISTMDIAGVTSPATGVTPVLTIADTTEYSATIAWSPSDTPFAPNTTYTATILITPKPGYTLTGVVANFFTVDGATTATNSADSGVVTAVFPATVAVVNLSSPQAGDITIVAGTGTAGYSGDEGPALNAELSFPRGMVMDGSGNLYIADSGNNRLRKVDASAKITTVNSSMGNPGIMAVTTDANGNVYVADGERQIYKISGEASSEILPDPGYNPWGLVLNSSSSALYFVDPFLTNMIQKMDITTAGLSAIKYRDDTREDEPQGVAMDSQGSLYITGTNHAVWKLLANGSYQRFAGTDMDLGDFAGDNGPANAAKLSSPKGIAVDSAGNVYIADSANFRVRKVDTTGKITTVAGNGVQGNPVNGPATESPLNEPEGLAIGGDGNLYIADSGANCILKVELISTEHDITSFTVPGQTVDSVINSMDHTVSFRVPYRTDIENLTPTLTVSSGATVLPSSETVRNFNSAQSYTVMAEDGTQQAWTVTCVVEVRSGKDITGFTVTNQAGNSTIDALNHSVSFHIPYGSDVTSLKPLINVSPGASITPALGTAVNFSGVQTYTVTAEDETKQIWTVTCTVNPNNVHDITEFTVPNQVGDASIDTENHSVTFHMPYGTDVTALAPEVTVSATALLSPISGTTLNFSSLVIYTVTAQDGTPREWTVNCTIDDPLNEITGFSVPNQVGTTIIDKNEHSVTFNMAYGSNVTALTPVVTVTTGASFYVSDEWGGRIYGAMDFTYPVSYHVFTDDNSPGISYEHIWTVTCIINPNTENDIAGFAVTNMVGDPAIDTANQTVTFHMPYGSDVTALMPAISVSDECSIAPASQTARNFSSPQTYTVTAHDGTQQVWTITCVVDKNTNNSIISFTVENQVGEAEIDTENHSVLFHMPYGTDVIELSPTMTISAEGTLTPLSGTDRDFTNPQTYTITAQNGTAQIWTVTCVVDRNTANDITGFSLTGQVGVAAIDAANQTIIFHMPFGTNVSTLAPVLELSAEATVLPASGSANDFSAPVTYTVTAQNGTTREWTLTCIIDQNTSNDINDFTVSGQTGISTIDATNHTVIFHMPYGTDVSVLIPSLTVSTEATLLPASGLPNDFREPVNYTVNAQNGTPQVWVVTCVVDKNTANDMTGFVVENQVGTPVIDTTNHSVTFHMPYGTDVTTLTPVLTLSAEAVVSPESGVSRNFTAAQSYIVTAKDNTTQVWTVNCVVDKNTANDITGFAVPGQMGDTKINTSNHSVSFQMPYGSDVTALKPLLTVSVGAMVSPTLDIGVNFSMTQSFTVTAQNGTPQAWTVTCLQKNTANDITGFTVPEQAGTPLINPSNHTVSFQVPSGTNIASLTPAITLSLGATISPVIGTPRDFRNTVTYLVTAEDGVPQLWTVSCNFYYRERKDSGSSTPPPVVQPSDLPPVITKTLEEVILPAKKTVISIATEQASGINAAQATLNGQVISSGGGYLTKVSFRYQPEGDSKWLYTATQSVSLSDGETFSARVSDLKPNTNYQFQARANGENGMGEGETLKFTTTKTALPTVTTLESVVTGPTTASISGSILDNGGNAISDSGFEWGLDRGNLQKQRAAAGEGNTLTLSLPALTSDTVYYFRAFAANSSGIAKGELLSFKIPLSLTVTLKATDIGFENATLQGSVKGSGRITDSGFTVNPGLTALLHTVPQADGSFSAVLEGLTPGTTYFYAAFAKDAKDGEMSGSVESFTTLSKGPEVATKPVTEITQIMATVNGAITDKHGFAITESGFLWGTDQQPQNKVIVHPAEDGITLSFTLSGLQGETTYYAKAYAVNAEGTGYGETVSFKTEPATLPIVETKSVDFDPVSEQWVLIGSIVSNGGVPLIEYGLKLSSDQKIWLNSVLGLEHSGDFISRGLSSQDSLVPGLYYLQAYALNTAGEGVGEVLSFTVPKLPGVKARYDKAASGPESAALNGEITDTGASGVVCHATKFLYRIAGSKEWAETGVAYGATGSSFDFILNGLKRGTNYEFRAMAKNAFGWGSSESVTFTTSLGLTDKEAAEYMKAAGFEAVVIANELLNGYGDTDTQAFEAMKYASFTAIEIVGALKDSNYKLSLAKAVELLKNASYDALSVTEVIRKVFRSEILRLGSGHEDSGVAIALKNAGFSIDDIVTIMVKFFGYQHIDCALNLPSILKNEVTFNTIYKAIFRLYGLESMISCAWTILHLDTYWKKPSAQSLQAMAKILRDDAGLTPLEVAEKLKQKYPSLDVVMLANIFYYTGYRAAEAGAVVAHIFGDDLQALAQALVRTYYKTEDIEAFLVNDMNCSAQQMVPIATNILRGDPVNNLYRIFNTYYHLEAVDAAKTLYAGGWTEQVKESYPEYGYGLGDLMYMMKGNYGITTDRGMIGVLKEIGLTPQMVAQKVGGKQGWLADYRANGYTAADAATWVQSDYAKYSRNSQIGATIRFLLEAGYGLVETALAIKTIYELDQQSAYTYFVNNSKLNPVEINDALVEAYGIEPILNAILAMKNAGATVVQIVNSLRNTYMLKDPVATARYLVQADYDEPTVLNGIARIYYYSEINPNYELRDLIGNLFQLEQEVFKQQNLRFALDAALFCVSSESSAKSVVALLKSNKYTIKETAQILKDQYSQNIGQVLEAIGSFYGSYPEIFQVYNPIVLEVFGLDRLSYIQHKKRLGVTAVQVLEIMINDLGIKDQEIVAELLYQAGYEKNEVAGALVKGFYQEVAMSKALIALDQLLQKVYQQPSQDNIAALLTASGVGSRDKAIVLLHQAGYNLEMVVRALKEVYSVTAEEAADLLAKSGYYQQADITVQVDTIYKGDYILLTIKYWQSKGITVDKCYERLQDEMGIKDPAMVLTYLKKAGYTAREAWIAVYEVNHDYPETLKKLGKTLQSIYQQSVQDNIVSLLEAAGVTTPSGAIGTLHRSEYPLEEIVRVLKDVYKVSSEQATELLVDKGYFEMMDIGLQVTGIYGGDYNLLTIQYWQSQGFDAKNVYDDIVKTLGIMDHAKVFNYLRLAGYSEEDCWKAVGSHWDYKSEVVTILKNVYGNKDPKAIGKQFQDLNLPELNFDMDALINGLNKVFPGISNAMIARALQAAGFPAYEDGGRSSTGNNLFSWIRKVKTQRDDELAAVVGYGDGRIGLYPHQAIEILHGWGYNLDETISWLLKGNYTWEEMFDRLVTYYVVEDPPVHGTHGNPRGGWGGGVRPKYRSGAVSLLATLKGRYGIDEMARGDFYHHKTTTFSNVGTSLYYKEVYYDLMDVGYTPREAVSALAKIGTEAMQGLVGTMYKDSISRGNQGQCSSAVAIADILYDVAKEPGIIISLKEIVAGLLQYSPDNSRDASFSYGDIYNGVKSIAGKRLQEAKLNMPTDTTALSILRDCGLSVRYATAMLEEDGVGLSVGNWFTAAVGLEKPWLAAVKLLVEAGYGAEESSRAVGNNNAYKNMMGLNFAIPLLMNFATVYGPAGLGITVSKYAYNLGTDLDRGNYVGALIETGFFTLSMSGKALNGKLAMLANGTAAGGQAGYDYITFSNEGRTPDNFDEKTLLALAPPLLVKAGFVGRSSETNGTVAIYSNLSGNCYYKVVDRGEPEPIIDTNGSGIKFTGGINSLANPVGLTSKAQNIYIKVKDDFGRVSPALKIPLTYLR